MSKSIPVLRVEGPDDVGVIGALLARHGLNTRQGERHLFIQPCHGDVNLLDGMEDAIRASSASPVGFVLDIDIELPSRWAAVRQRLRAADVDCPEDCPPTGFIGRVTDYPAKCGVWLMPDCVSDNTKIEHLCQTLIPVNDPLQSHSKVSVDQAAKLVDEANSRGDSWGRFREVDRIKAEMHTWIAWQQQPGAPLGAAINAQVLSRNSPEAVAFLRWLWELYDFPQQLCP